MTALYFYELKPDEKKLIFTTTGVKAGLPAYAVEKD